MKDEAFEALEDAASEPLNFPRNFCDRSICYRLQHIMRISENRYLRG
jgi:hypothetical protein